MNANVQLPPILSIAVFPVLWCIQEKNNQVLDEWILVAFFSFHFNPAAIEVHENYLFLFIPRLNYPYASLPPPVTKPQIPH